MSGYTPSTSGPSAERNQNGVTTWTGVSSTDGVTPTLVYVNPISHRALVDETGSGTITVYNDTVSGTINSSNVTFTVPNTIAAPITLFLAGSPYQNVVDYTYSGTTITMNVAPDASLSGQPFWLAHI